MIKRTALVTGASRGIGRAIAELLTDTGHSVLIPTRSEMDLASTESIRSYLASLTAPIEILVNDAGINHVAPLADIKNQELQDALNINLTAPFQLVQSVSAQMQEARFGRIVNISSIWSIVSRAGRITYSMSKSALNGMTRSMAIELAPYNILVNAVAPGYVLTDLTRQNNSDEELVKISKAIPLQRLASPAEIAGVVAFLCSEQNTYMTGQTVIVDGGFSCL
jgi:3-oxoacyl-[acyl-carrier protein] reductase